MKIQQMTINLSVKQPPPDLLQKFLHRPVFQLALFRLADQQTLRRQIGKRLQAQFVGMYEVSHIVRWDHLTFRVRNRR